MDDLNNVTSQRCSFSLLASHLLGRTKKWNASNTNAGGWDSSTMRTYLNSNVFNALPRQWRAMIKTVQVLASAGGTSATIKTSEDKLFLFSRAEVGFDVSAVPYTNEVDAGAEKKTFELFTDNNSRIKKTYNNTGSAGIWWLRSPDASNSTYFCNVYNNGNSSSNSASNGNSISFGFCI